MKKFKITPILIAVFIMAARLIYFLINSSSKPAVLILIGLAYSLFICLLLLIDRFLILGVKSLPLWILEIAMLIIIELTWLYFFWIDILTIQIHVI